MKRFLAVILAVMLLAAVIPVTSLAEAASNGDTTMYHVQTNGGTLYVRTGPGVKYRSITSLPNRTALTRLSKSGNWYKIKTMNGLVGWVSKNYVKSNAYANVTTNTDPLRVRSSRNASSTTNIVGRLPHGTKRVTVTKINGNWAYVNWNRIKGWASRSYLAWTHW